MRFRVAEGAAGLVLALMTACPGALSSYPAEGPVSPHDAVREIKELEKSLGLKETGSFLKHSDNRAAYYRCYYTGKLSLPDSYEGLELRQSNEPGCRIDERKYDVFPYRIEAVASGSTPVTPALAEAPLERFAVVVAHEDFHQQQEIRGLPERIAEAASTLAGFITAAEFARKKFGESSPAYQGLAREAGLFLRKAEIVNGYHAKLTELYASVRKGLVSAEEALSMKSATLAEFERECRALAPDPRSFNKCLGANNNAGLAFDVTYTKFYPLVYELFEASGRDLRATLAALKEAGKAGTGSEEKTAGHLRSAIEARRLRGAPPGPEPR